jgi:hypothetical protein
MFLTVSFGKKNGSKNIEAHHWLICCRLNVHTPMISKKNVIDKTLIALVNMENGQFSQCRIHQRRA